MRMNDESILDSICNSYGLTENCMIIVWLGLLK